jgi:peroxiredoxin
MPGYSGFEGDVMFCRAIEEKVSYLRRIISHWFSTDAWSSDLAATYRLQSTPLRLVSMIVTLSLLLLPSEARSSGPKPPPAGKAAIVEKAPDFVLRDLNGRRFRLSDFKERQPVLIIFGATWCTFCREGIPHYKSLHAAYAKRGLEIVNIDIQESREKVAKFSAKYDLPYRVLLDEDGVVSGVYEIRGVPSIVLVNQDGNIVCRQCQQVEPLIEAVLKKK